MARDLMPNTSVLVGPRWIPGTVLYTDDEGVHVMSEDGEYAAHAPSKIAVVGDVSKAEDGDDVLVELGDRWHEAKLLDTKRGMVRVVARDSGEQWVPLQSVAALAGKVGAEPEPGATEAEEGDKPLSFGIRLSRLGWRHGHLILLGFGLLGFLFILSDAGNGWSPTLAWLALHGILAAYVLSQNRPLPRFHPAGFGKADDPGVFDRAYALERPPIRGKWEVGVFLVGGWVVLGLGAVLPGYPPVLGAGYLSVVALLAALLAYLHDRHSAAEARRLLGATPIRDGADSGEGCVVGTLSGTREDQPALWREILLYTWSITSQVQKTITDSDGRTQTVMANETTHYACGLRREREREALILATPVGEVEVPLRGAIWAATRELEFGKTAGKSQVWKPNADHYGGAVRNQVSAAVLEAIHPGEKLAVVGELRRGTDGSSRMIGGKDGPTVMFSAGEGEPLAALRRDLLRRRLLLAAIVVLGLCGWISVVL